MSGTMEFCGGKTYDQIWKIFSTKHGDTPDMRRIHNK